MNLFELLKSCSVTSLEDMQLPTYLMGSFRRKSISFFNGLTDEKTTVYWFQSKSFSIDLRLSDPMYTPISERQGWIGDTIWDSEKELLSWNIRESYQPSIQWPEPAKLFPIGNCILEFAPSGAYVEDWRQQSSSGLFCGLRLYQTEHLQSQQKFAMDGGLIIAGEHLAYVQSRLPFAQQQLENIFVLNDAIQNQQIDASLVENYQVSIALNGQTIQFSTQSCLVNTTLDLDNFEMDNLGNITQIKEIEGVLYRLYFSLDMYQPDFQFELQTSTTASAQQWLDQEKSHLLKHAVIVK
ncbi:hypothetical protein [Acinetobacter guerrae]|uniref:hypothetical protein n=1 Tax=Acinetobacter guerrae TaxID=1843371 RepID=UPI00125EB2C6|nr:hypothetical protein [Acinetobacter guerrae]